MLIVYFLKLATATVCEILNCSAKLQQFATTSKSCPPFFENYFMPCEISGYGRQAVVAKSVAVLFAW